MTPEVDRAAGLVVARLGLTGPALDRFVAIAEQAATVEDLPAWAHGVLDMVATERANPPQRPADDPHGDGFPAVDYPDDDEQRLWLEAGERQLITDINVRAPRNE